MTNIFGKTTTNYYKTDRAICATLTDSELNKLYTQAGIIHDSYKNGLVTWETPSNVITAVMSLKNAIEDEMTSRRQ